MSTKHQKKYKTRESILRDIEIATQEMWRLRKDAALQDDASKAFAQLGTPLSGEQATQARDAANKLWDAAKRIEQTRLLKLKHTLAAFDTKPMGFADDQVVLQRI